MHVVRQGFRSRLKRNLYGLGWGEKETGEKWKT